MILTKVVEKIKTRVLFTIILSRNSCRVLHNVEKCDTVEVAKDDKYGARALQVGYLRLTHTHTHTHTRTHTSTIRICFLILIAFPRQKWLRHRASMLRL
jgi:hypothetical protein